jgi:integrase-like protein
VIRVASPEDAPELVGGRHLELIVTTVFWPLVGAPAQELRGMPEPRPLHVVVRDLADALGPEAAPSSDPCRDSTGCWRRAAVAPAAERFIQTALREWAYVRPYYTSAERAAILPGWLEHYNCARAHGSLDAQRIVHLVPGLDVSDSAQSS